MKVIDYCNVYDRGWVLICEKEKISLDDVVVAHDIEFSVRRIETATNVNWISLVLSPNNIVPDCFEIGDEIILKEK